MATETARTAQTEGSTKALRRARAAAWAASLVILAAAAPMLAGCGPGEVKAPNPMRALDERRAIEVIRRAVQREGMEPAPGRDVALPTTSTKTFHIDVGIQGKDYGIAYITSQDATDLGAAIPPPNKKEERLRIEHVGADGETRVVLLYQDNYLYDDLVGESHGATTITAESQLGRDVGDFITHARTQKYK
jgi:hypothetical protein